MIETHNPNPPYPTVTDSSGRSPEPSASPQPTAPSQGPTDPPAPGSNGDDGSGGWPSRIVSSLSLDRGLPGLLPVLAGAIVVMGLTLLVRPPRQRIG
ncbi:MAG: hypothetical protein KBG85_19045 [Micropruina sp.]|nr:hypothetical protein [Micropruina sp.]